jgi:hypothetical protein
LTVTEPAGSSEAPLPVSPSAGGNLTSIGEQNASVPSAYPVVARLGAADLLGQTPRESTPPKNELDANDRCEIRATSSEGALDRQIKFEKHRDWLEWQRTKRYLLFFGGLMALCAAFAFGLKYAGVPPEDVAKLTLLTLVSGISGYGLRTLTTKALYAISSRNRSSQDESSR